MKPEVHNAINGMMNERTIPILCEAVMLPGRQSAVADQNTSHCVEQFIKSQTSLGLFLYRLRPMFYNGDKREKTVAA